ncbi:MAG: hypothetical protein LBU65_15870 [Planctomycetaceae bacterium]|jgi:hypothetical protein|nr:hypothetical protein [Planctomycetaceae bacterium]
MRHYLYILYIPLVIIAAAFCFGCRENGIVSSNASSLDVEVDPRVDAELERQAAEVVKKMLAEDKERAAQLITLPGSEPDAGATRGSDDNVIIPDVIKTNGTDNTLTIADVDIQDRIERERKLAANEIEFLVSEAEQKIRNNDRAAAIEAIKRAELLRGTNETTLQRIANCRRFADVYRQLGRKEQAIAEIKNGLAAAALVNEPIERLLSEIALIEAFIQVGGNEPIEHIERLDKWVANNLSEEVTNNVQYEMRRDLMLKSIVKYQAWLGTLEDAWEAIELIKQTTVRDFAITEVIDMLIRNDKPDDAVAWLEEIKDDSIRKALTERIESTKRGSGVDTPVSNDTVKAADDKDEP